MAPKPHPGSGGGAVPEAMPAARRVPRCRQPRQTAVGSTLQWPPHTLAGVTMRKLVLGHAEELRGLIRASGCCTAAQRLDHKLHCALLVAEGRSCYEVARWFGESPRTIERWTLAFSRGGDQGLKPQGRKGRPARLNESALSGLLRELSASPAEFGYDARVWSPQLLRQHLGTRYQVSLSLRQCQRTWRRLQTLRPS